MEFNYKVKQKKEDFIVDEISLQPDFYHCKKSNFSYLWIEKRGMQREIPKLGKVPLAFFI